MDNILLLFDAPSLLAQLIIDGILVGAIYVLAAYGMALVWGVMKIINVVQGEFVLLGGYVTFFIAQAGLHPFLGIPVSAAVLYLVGWGLYRSVIFRVIDKDLFISILATFGLSILIQQGMNEWFGADIRTAQAGLDSLLLFDAMIVISWVKIFGFFSALALGLGLMWFLRSSKMGQSIRATAQNPRAAKIMGIDIDKVYAQTYALNAAICGAAGALVVMVWFAHPYAGLAYTLRSFMIVIIAGLGNLFGVVIAGMGLGAAEGLAGFIIGVEFQAAFVFSALVLILVWRSFKLSRKRMVLE